MDDRNPTLTKAPRPGIAPAAPHAAVAPALAPYDDPRSAPDLTYSAKTLGPKYPPHKMNGTLFEPIDMAGLAAAIVITLGPLAAYSLGLGA